MASINTTQILRAVCSVCNVEIKEVKSNRRYKNIVNARHIYAYVACQMKLQSVAHKIINKDHSTIIASKKKVKYYLTQPHEDELRKMVHSVLKELIDLPCVKNGQCKYENGFIIPLPCQT